MKDAAPNSPSPSPLSTDTSQPLAGTLPVQQIKLPGVQTAAHTPSLPLLSPLLGTSQTTGSHSRR